MEEKNKKLDAYFKAARSQRPAVPLETLKATIQQLPVPSAGAGTGSATTSTFTIKQITAMTASIIGAAAIVVGAIVWHAEPQQVQEQQTTDDFLAIETEATSDAAFADADTTEVQELHSADALEIEPAKKENIKQKQLPQNVLSEQALEAPKAKDTAVVDNNEPTVGEGEKVFESITLLKLQDSVLAELGILRTEGRIVYDGVIVGAEKPGEKSFLKLIITEGRIGGKLESAAFEEITTDFIPLFMSVRNGQQPIRINFGLLEDNRHLDETYFKGKLNTLVPILVELKEGIISTNDVIFWFEPTADFINLLPETVAREVKREHAQLALLEGNVETADTLNDDVTKSSAATAEEANINFKSESGSSAAIVYATVFPNPASGKINLTMGLKKKEAVRVSLVSIEGKLIKSFTNYKTYEANTLMEQFDISGISPGLYILLIDTRSGSRHTQRVVVQ